MVTETLADLLKAALDSAVADGVIDASPTPTFERPNHREHGDWATNVALVAAKGKGSPRDIAQALVERLPDTDLIERVDVAGPGFINFYLSPRWLHDVVRRAAAPDSRFGRARSSKGEKVNVEFVSANPTGPVSVVSGRHAAVGDAIASLLEADGYTVFREFYMNDVGRQIDLFGESIAVHYLQLFGHDADLPDEGYQGEYVKELAEEIAQQIGDRLVESAAATRNVELADLGLKQMVEHMKATLENFGTRFDLWFSERALHGSGAIQKGIEALRTKGYVEDRDGAVWFLSSRLGDDKDRVLVRSNGTTTYLAADVGYLTDKFSRGHDHLIYLWGADHHGTVARLKAAAEALGFDRDRVEVKLLQIVKLKRGGEMVKASKRGGVILELDELIEEVGVDAARYTFLTRSLEAPIDFDIEAVKQQAPENPVYYVQYAHARICSILRKATNEGHNAAPDSADLDLLTHPSEDRLMRKLASFEEEIPLAAQMRAPQRITRYVEELASDFSAFYRDCKVVTDDAGPTGARLALCVATRRVIADGLGLLGVGAPEVM